MTILTDQLVVNVEVDVEEVPDEDHSTELHRPGNACGLRLPVSLRRRGSHGRRLRRHRPSRRSAVLAAVCEQGGLEQQAAPPNAERQHGRAGGGDRAARGRRRRRERDMPRGQGRRRAPAQRRPAFRGGVRRGRRRRRRGRHALHLSSAQLLRSFDSLIHTSRATYGRQQPRLRNLGGSLGGRLFLEMRRAVVSTRDAAVTRRRYL